MWNFTSKIEWVYSPSKHCALELAEQIESDFAHGCNIQGSLRDGTAGGIAKKVGERYPAARAADIDPTIGGFTSAVLNEERESRIFNFYTQYASGSGSLSYLAMYDAFLKYFRLKDRKEVLVVPEIGCGIAGGTLEGFLLSLSTALDDYNHFDATVNGETKPIKIIVVSWETTEDKFCSVAESIRHGSNLELVFRKMINERDILIGDWKEFDKCARYLRRGYESCQ